MLRKAWILVAALAACGSAVAVAACGSPDAARDAADEESGRRSGGDAERTATSKNLGTVRLDAGCSEAANEHAERGLALLHHMTYIDAGQAFAAVVEADPSCTLGYWGQAMTIIHPLWPDVPDAAGMARGQELVDLARAQTSPEGRSAAYLATVEAYFRDAAERGERDRLLDFERAWRAAFEAYPDDLEARALYSLSHLATASPSDKTYAHQYEALDLLDDVLEAIPDHPGAHHYIIHARDFPPLAEEAIDVARAYGKLAPDIPHALHMPTHIYTRVGLWDESIVGNDRAAESSWLRGQDLGGITTDFHHALDYLAYAHLQRGQDAAARQVMERALAADGPWAAVNMPAIAYALAAIPARFALERQDWGGAAGLQTRQPDGFPWSDGFAPFEALTYFAKGLGAARTGQREVAEIALDSLDAMGARVSETSSDAYWSSQIDVQVLAIRAWLAFERGDSEGGLRLMSEAAELEASTGKNPVTPGELLPASELLGEMRLMTGDADGALSAFQAALTRSPNRLNGLAGAARAAQASGQNDLAEEYYRQLLELTADADTERPVMVEARDFLGESGP